MKNKAAPCEERPDSFEIESRRIFLSTLRRFQQRRLSASRATMTTSSRHRPNHTGFDAINRADITWTFRREPLKVDPPLEPDI